MRGGRNAREDRRCPLFLSSSALGESPLQFWYLPRRLQWLQRLSVPTVQLGINSLCAATVQCDGAFPDILLPPSALKP